MSDIIDDIGNVLVKARDYIEEHPWQTAAVLLGPIGIAGAAGAAATEAAVAKGCLPHMTIGEFSDIGVKILTGAPLTACEMTLLGPGAVAGAAAGGAAGAALKGMSEAVKCHEKANANH